MCDSTIFMFSLEFLPKATCVANMYFEPTSRCSHFSKNLKVATNGWNKIMDYAKHVCVKPY